MGDLLTIGLTWLLAGVLSLVTWRRTQPPHLQQEARSIAAYYAARRGEPPTPWEVEHWERRLRRRMIGGMFAAYGGAAVATLAQLLLF